MNRRILASVMALSATASIASAQPTMLAPSRAVDWSKAGVTNGIPNRTLTCANISAGASAATINSAIASCPAGQVVKLAAGTYNIGSPGILFTGKSNVTLRGAGPDATFLNFSSENACGGPSAAICIMGANIGDFYDSPSNVANWTSGLTKGSTTITLSNTSNIQVGSLLLLDQVKDPAGDNGNLYDPAIPGTTCFNCNNPGRPNRTQHQLVTVTSVSGNSVGISPSVYMPNWRASQSPQAAWGNTPPSSGDGVEDLSINLAGSRALSGVQFYHVVDSWLKNVRSLNAANHHVKFFVALRNTVRDSYFFGTQAAASESYGVNTFLGHHNLVENNIFQHIAVPMMNEGGVGSVFGYNYSVNDFYADGSWQQASQYHHSAGNAYILWESNDGPGLTEDDFHGAAFFVTSFRNRMNGKDGPNVQSQTVPVMIYSFSRYANLIGNVLGTSGFHSTYQMRAGTESQNSTTCYHSIYALGWGANCENGGSGGFPINDPSSVSTMLRWGNYDTVNAGARFIASEVPSGLSIYSNPLPSSNTLPDSFYLAGKPSWFGVVPWPAIGPDVTGGSEPNVGGHNAKIPARRCFESVMGGTFSDASAKTFNATNCYTSSPAPTAPTNLRIVGASLLLFPLLLPGLLRRRRRDAAERAV